MAFSTHLSAGAGAGEQKADEINLLDEIKQMQIIWKQYVVELKNLMYDTPDPASAHDPKVKRQLDIRQKIKELKEAHPFTLGPDDFSAMQPRVLKEKSPADRDPTHVEKYLNLYKKIKTCSQREIDNISNQLSGSRLSRVDFAAWALLIAFKHHLFTIFCQENAQTDAFADYIFIKLRGLALRDPTLNKKEIDQARNEKLPRAKSGEKLSTKEKKSKLSFLANVRDAIILELQQARQTKIEKRKEFNHNLPCDYAEQPHIQALIHEQKFQLIEVTIEESKANRLKVKEQTSDPREAKVISQNAVVVDKDTRRVLGILINNQFSQTDVDPLISELNQKTSSFWKRDARGGTQTKLREDEKRINKGASATVGKLNFYRKNNSDSATGKKNPKIVSGVKRLASQMDATYKKLLPNTYATAFNQTKDFREAGLLINDSVFSTATLNHNNPVGPHRDQNFHNYGCMFVMESKISDQPTLTCFPEWKISDNGQEKFLGFHVQNLGAVICNFDYIHSVPVINSERYSVVLYTYKELMVSPILGGYDSELEESDFEENRPTKKQKVATLSQNGAGAGSGAGSGAGAGSNQIPIAPQPMQLPIPVQPLQTPVIHPANLPALPHFLPPLPAMLLGQNSFAPVEPNDPTLNFDPNSFFADDADAPMPSVAEDAPTSPTFPPLPESGRLSPFELPTSFEPTSGHSGFGFFGAGAGAGATTYTKPNGLGFPFKR